jgi:NADH-quinone oxidoreductase subunit F
MLRGDKLLAEIEKAELVGRGGAAFPVVGKWRRIRDLDKPKKYVVCNASEGEPDVSKDYFLLEHHPGEVFKGLLLAMDFLETKEGYFYINKHYYQALQTQVDQLLASCQKRGYLVHLFIEEPSYIGGETGSLLNAIEGKKVQPRYKNPSPSVLGIFGVPVLLHNVETLYDVACVAEGTFEHTRLATISGDGVANPDVYRVRSDQNVLDILRQTNNYPSFDFFVQVGGGAAGEVLTSVQAATAVLSGSGSIKVFPKTISPYTFLQQLFAFYDRESCGKCSPCRDGAWQLVQLLAGLNEQSELPWAEFSPIIKIMDKGSFCNLGKSIALPVRSYALNILGIKV